MATILIVDDHVLNRQFLTALLGFGNHRLLEASDGLEGLKIVRKECPELVITDILMPNMDGYEFVTRMRADSSVKDTPVIFYTSTYSTREATAMAHDCGVRWVLQKPSPPDLILQTVHEALGLSMPIAGHAVSMGPAPTDSSLAVIDNRLADYLRELETSRQLMSQITAGSENMPSDRQNLQQVTQQLTQSLSDLQTVSLRLTSLIDMGLEMAVERDPGRLLETGCRVARHISVARYAVIGIPDENSEKLRHFAVRGLEPEVRDQFASLPPTMGVLGSLLNSRGPQRMSGLSGDPQAIGLPASHPPVHSFLGVPVASSGRGYGWMYLVDKLGAEEFSEVDEQVVVTVATQLAVAYENLMLQMSLREREAGLQRAQLVAQMAHIITGPDGSFESWSATLPRLIGIDDTAMPATIRKWLDIVDPADRDRFRDTCIAAGRTGRHMEIEYRMRRGDGTLIHVRQVLEPLEGQPGHGGQMRWINTIQDITEQKEQQRRIARLSQIYAVLSGINSAIVRIRDRDELLQEACRVAVGHGAFNMAWAGIVDPDTLDGKVVAWCGNEPGYAEKIRFTARAGTADSDRPACIAVREGRQVICNDIDAEPSLAPSREELLARGHRSVAALPLIIGGQTVAVITLFAGETGFFDDEELKLLSELAGDLSFGLQFIDKEERLNYLAYYDALTGLPNSMLLNDRLAQFLHAANGNEVFAAAIVIDLDRFAELNDALGRHAGDTVLKMVAQRLNDELQEPYSLARISGDTFAIAVSGLQRGADAAALLEQQILQPLDRPFTVDQQEVRISAHAGIALYPADGRDAETLLKHAEVALKKAKSSGERYLYYAPQMNAAIAAKMSLESALRKALEAREFVMYYQPRVDLLSGRIVSAEALIRWRHPQRGMVPPAEFIPLAEETGLIVPIGDWVIDMVCSQQAAWRARQVEIVPVAINLSAVQFKKGMVPHIVRDAIARHGLEQQHVEFELTESMVMDDPEIATRNLQELKSLGAQLSLDDFGTGYSSLAYLKRFPFDFVKIDRAFITDITRNPGDAAISTAVIAMAHSLGLRVVAEGVETEGQLQFLRRYRCDELQGYYFSPPVPHAEFEAMLREGKRLTLAPEPAQHENTLLIVDDELNNLSALRRLFRQERYRVLTASSGQEGLELLAVNPVQVILSDQRMPGMSGAQFLGIVKNLYPDTIRIILSGYTDLQSVTDSVNQGAVFKFLTKPWDDELLREHIRDAFRRYRPRS